MSTARAAVADRFGALATAFRAYALAGAAVLTGAYLATLYHVIDVVGGPGGLELFVAVVAGSLGLAAVLGQTLRVRHAFLVGLLLMVLGLGAYLLTIPEGTLDVERQLQDTFALVTGLSVLRMTKAGVWALGFAPGPLFVSTYLFLRRRYGLGVLVGGGALAFFISTGDVGPVHGLVGTLGAVAALGFGRLDREGGVPVQRDSVVALLVAILVVATSISLVPGGQAQPLVPGDRGQTIESTLVEGGESVTILGSISLSPKVRFVVQADRPSRWKVGAFDRYTGSGWVRSGQTQAYDGPLSRPLSERISRLRQTYQVRSETAVMPAAWKPARVVDGGDEARVTSMGSLEPRDSLAPGDEYTVLSFQGVRSPDDLRAAGTDYPEGLADRYTQLPESTPDRVGEFTAQLTAEAENPYDTARVIEQWLEANKEYSLDVDRPQGDIAASFIFEMERGYCTYYATAMITMLRSQGIPARFVTGYTAGESVDDDRWVVRGLDSHAWVEVYFPDHGWVAFDPTPAAPRQAAEQTQIERARAADVSGVDTDDTNQQELTPVTETPAEPTAPVSPGATATASNGTPTVPPALLGARGDSVGTATGGLGSRVPDEETVLYGFILLLGAVTAAHRTGVLERGRRLVWIRRTPDGPPDRRIEATFARLDYLLGRRYRPRAPGETPRAYLRSLRAHVGPTRDPDAAAAGSGPFDRRVDRLFDLHEQARYAGRASATDAGRAWRLFTELREEWSSWR